MCQGSDAELWNESYFELVLANDLNGLNIPESLSSVRACVRARLLYYDPVSTVRHKKYSFYPA